MAAKEKKPESLESRVMRLEKMEREHYKINKLQTDKIDELLRIVKGDPSTGFPGIVEIQKSNAMVLAKMEKWFDVLTAKWFWKVILWIGLTIALGILLMRYGVDFMVKFLTKLL